MWSYQNYHLICGRLPLFLFLYFVTPLYIGYVFPLCVCPHLCPKSQGLLLFQTISPKYRRVIPRQFCCAPLFFPFLISLAALRLLDRFSHLLFVVCFPISTSHFLLFGPIENTIIPVWR